MREVFRTAARLGLTGVHNMSGLDQVGRYLDFARSGELPLRVWFGAIGPEAGAFAAARERAAEELAAITAERGPTFEVGYAKLIADGVLSARTAALLHPYADAPGETGFLVTEAGALRNLAGGLNAANIPVSIHAIGDRGVRVALDAFEAARRGGAAPDLPNRIEHLEVVDTADVERFRELGVLASFNPHHCITGIGVYNTDRLGEERVTRAFAWGTLRDAGASLVFGSDWATAPLDPLRQLYAATVREKPDRRSSRGAGTRASGSASKRRSAPTRWHRPRPAGWDDEVGSIREGKRADFVVLSGPVPDPPDRSLLDLEVVSTWLSGLPHLARRPASSRRVPARTGKAPPRIGAAGRVRFPP